LSKPTTAVKGNINQQKMHARSTKIKEQENCVNETETVLDNGLKNTLCICSNNKRWANTHRSDWMIPSGIKQRQNIHDGFI
jgi:hypothetical protein